MELYLDVFNQNVIVYEFRNFHINLIQNKHVKLDETYIDRQGRFKENLLNIMKVLGCLTSKLHKTLHTDYVYHNNSFMNLITS